MPGNMYTPGAGTLPPVLAGRDQLLSAPPFPPSSPSGTDEHVAHAR